MCRGRLPTRNSKEPINVLASRLEEIGKSIGTIDAEIASAHKRCEKSQLLDEIPGIGTIIATAITASAPDAGVFKSGRDFAAWPGLAWLGLAPRQNSSGGKQPLGAITKQGNQYIRKLLVLAATSLLHAKSKRKAALHDWIATLLAKKPARLVTVALANKIARII